MIDLEKRIEAARMLTQVRYEACIVSSLAWKNEHRVCCHSSEKTTTLLDMRKRSDLFYESEQKLEELLAKQNEHWEKQPTTPIRAALPRTPKEM